MPWSRTSGAMTSATEPAAADTIAGRPPTIEITTAMTTLENRPTAGSTPATTENEIASGMSASAVTMPGEDLAREHAGASGGPTRTLGAVGAW